MGFHATWSLERGEGRVSVLGGFSAKAALIAVAVVVVGFVLPPWHGKLDDSNEVAFVPSQSPAKPGVESSMDFFIENVGQVENENVLYYTRSGHMQTAFGKGQVILDLTQKRGTTPGGGNR